MLKLFAFLIRHLTKYDLSEGFLLAEYCRVILDVHIFYRLYHFTDSSSALESWRNTRKR